MRATTWSLMNNHAKQSTDLRVNIYICSSKTNKQTGGTENDEIDARNIRTSLYDRPIAFHKENYI